MLTNKLKISAVIIAGIFWSLQSLAETFTIKSTQKKGLEYHFDTQDESFKVARTKTGEPKVLGEGSMGIAIMIEVEREDGKDPEKMVLKYFKTNEFFSEDELLRYKMLAVDSVLNPDSLDKDELKWLHSAPGAAEDVVFDAQQRAERESLLAEARVTAGQEYQAFGVGAISVQPVAINVSVSEPGFFGTKKGAEKQITALIKPLMAGENLKKIIEEDRLKENMISSIISELVRMSYSGLFYDDLNEANWFVSEIKGGRYVALPFDMKPGVFVGSFEKALVKNCESAMKKFSPLGLSKGFLRNLIVKTKKAFHAGMYHANISETNDSLERLTNSLNDVIEVYR